MQALRNARNHPDPAMASFATLLADWDFSGIELRPPTTLIDERLVLDLDGVAGEFLWVGPAPTAGDVIVHLPAERVVFTGDLGRYDAPILRDPPAYRRSFCSRCGSRVPVLFPGNPAVAIPTGLVEEGLPVRAADHIWIAKKASWLDLQQLAALPQHPEDPPPDSNAELMRPLRLESR